MVRRTPRPEAMLGDQRLAVWASTLEVDFNRHADLLGDRRPDVGLGAWGLDRYDERIARAALVAAITGR